MSNSPSKPRPLLALNYKAPARVIISYNEALALLENFAGEDRKTLDKELSEILKLMIYSYFSKYAAVLNEPFDQRLYNLLESNQFLTNTLSDFDNSEIALAVTLSIIKTTQTFLPGFNSHVQSDCSAILDMEMRDRSSVIITIDPEAFERFAAGPSNPR